MNVLYIAASCNPYNGSEDKIGWSIPWESSKINNVWVITRADLKIYIENFLSSNEKRNIYFIYVEMPILCQTLLVGMLQSIKLLIWNQKSFHVAKDICIEKKIDIIHQVTPIEFRAIGNFGKIPGIKFVVGPLGGAEYIPNGLKSYAKNNIVIELIRYTINCFCRFHFKITGKLKNCDYVMFANEETRDFLIGSTNS